MSISKNKQPIPPTQLKSLLQQQAAKIAQLEKGQAIEAALDKVRTRTMAMQHPDELREVVAVLQEQITALQIADWGSNILIAYEEEAVLGHWIASFNQAAYPENYFIKGTKNQVIKEYWEHYQAQTPYFTINLTGQKKKDYDKFSLEETDFKRFPDHVKEQIRSMEKVYFSYAQMKYGHIVALDSKGALSEENFEILIRFAKVFEQAYTRFFDLQKAEAQAREAQIEAALERVRSATMAMHQSNELSEVTQVLFKELSKLNLTIYQTYVTIISEDEKSLEIWLTGFGGEYYPQKLTLSVDTFPLLENLMNEWRKGVPFNEYNFQGAVVKEWFDLLYTLTKNEIYLVEQYSEAVFNLEAVHKHGAVCITTLQEANPAAKPILARFAKVFEQSLIRFLDLQKAEAQAKEAKIEAALERVRSRTMAMHRSEELNEVVGILYQQFAQLTNNWGIELGIFNEPATTIELFRSNIETAAFPKSYFIKGKGHRVLKQYWRIWKDQTPNALITLKGKVQKNFLQYLLTHTDFRDLPESDKKVMEVPQVHLQFAPMQYGFLSVATLDAPFQQEDFVILNRFAKVFEQTYTRFLDIQKAEAQAKEAQIEAALERVRAAAMSMHKSGEISQVAATMMTQFNELGIPMLRRCKMYMIDQENEQIKCWYSTKTGTTFSNNFSMPVHGDEVVEQIFHSWENRQAATIEVVGETYKKYVQFLKKYGWKYPKGEKPAKRIVLNEFPFDNGLVEITTYEVLPEKDQQISWRFARVFEQAFTRFFDLQKAEKQAQEIEKVFNENQRLLHSILPKQIAEQIRTGQQTIVKRFEQVSILFADIVGFTVLAEKISPQEVVDILNGLFSKFDDLTDKYNLEKIKTIGDAYMVAAGVPEEKDNHAQLMFGFAKEMLQTLQDFNQTIGTNLKIRIGISSGPVVAGVIGKKKFAYDLWGDTVNTAARMEANGQADCIQISPITYEMLKDEAAFEKIPNVEIKGKGVMDVYLWSP